MVVSRSVIDIINYKHLSVINNTINESRYAFEDIIFDSKNNKIEIKFPLILEKQKEGRWWSLFNKIIRIRQRAILYIFQVMRYELEKDRKETVESDIFNIDYDPEQQMINIESYFFKTIFRIFVSDFHLKLEIIDE
mgnify:FL=1